MSKLSSPEIEKLVLIHNGCFKGIYYLNPPLSNIAYMFATHLG